MARERIEAPPFPRAWIRSARLRAARPASRWRPIAAAILASLSIVAVAAAAQILERTHLTFTPSGGLVISSSKSTSRSIHSVDDIREAASKLDFSAVLPAGLPSDAKPVKLDTAGTSLLTVTYDLSPVRGQARHLWIFLANAATMSGPNAHRASRARTGARYEADLAPKGPGYDVELARFGAEAVVIVSNGLTKAEIQTIKRAMQQEASR